MAIELQNKQNVDAPSGPYPYGNIKDETGTNDGTPVDKNTYADFHQFFAKILDDSGITPNNLPENATNGFQYFDALKTVANKYNSVDLYGVNTVLTTAAYGKLSIAFSASDTTITLPAITTTESTQRLAIAKIGGPGVCSVLLNVADIAYPTENVILNDGDSVVFVNAIFGWIVETVKRKAPYPANLLTGTTITLTEKELRKINIINYSGNTTVNLPALTTDYSGQMIAFQKEQPGIATIVPNGSDQLYPNVPINLYDGDSLILVNVLGVLWAPVSRAFATDIWHYVNSGGGEPPFQNTWVNKAGQPSEAAMRYRITNVNGKQYLDISGYLSNPTVGVSSMVIFTLPSAYRPKWDVPIVIIEEGTTINFHHVLVQSSGDVIFSPIGGTYASSGAFYTKFNATIPLD